MRAGFASFDITPPMGVPLGGNPRAVNAAVGIHDGLRTNVICLDDGNNRLLLVGLDLLGIDRALCDEIKAEIGRKTGIGKDHVMISATHTHSGPNVPRLYYSAYLDPAVMEREDAVLGAYRPMLCETVVNAATKASEETEECRIGFGCAEDERFSCNRRLRMKDGSIRMIFEPFTLEEIASLSKPESASRVSVLRFDDSKGRIRALWINYATHPAIACGLDYLISRDFVGYMTDELQERYGKDLVVLYANGAEGNMAAARPENGFINTFEECARVGTGLAQTVAKITDGIRTEEGNPSLDRTEETVLLPIRSFTECQVKEAEELIASSPVEIQPHGAPKLLSALATVKFHGRRGEAEPVLLQAFRIGELLLLAAPTETFRQIAQEAEEKWNGPAAFVGMANGYSGYVPTERAFSEGGYEVLPNEDSYFAPEAEHILEAGLCRMIERLDSRR